ncbi:MAG: S-layer homology domain-containing protein [Clostridia bacterium]|nr:S-layer homology domain-containing protein [Clostridia bacterium]
MKKLSLLLGLIAIIMITTSICFAAEFSDIKGTKFEKSVKILVDLSIVNGYEDGTYRPNKDVTRAEMAKLIIVTLGKETSANSLKGKTQFPDVVEGGWASGYINCAVSQGIIKGYPDGNFKPNNNVTYAEAATMLLRALNYTKELESKEYPTGYMTVANDAGILKDVQATKSSDNATRGYIANMIYNALKAGTRKIVSTTSDGKVNYGDGVSLVEQSFSHIKCIKDGEVLSVDFDEREIVVRDKTNNRKLTIGIEDEKEIRKLYGRKVDLIYDTEEKELIDFEITDSYTIKEVEVDRIKKDTIYDKNDNEYELPDDDDAILFQYITNYDEAEMAYITYDEKKNVISVVLQGTPKVNAGIVSDNDITVSKSKGIELFEVDDDYHEYKLSNSSQKTKVGEVVLYSLDNNDDIIIRDRISKTDAGSVQELTSKTIKVKINKKIYEMPENSEYYVYLVASENSIKEGKLSDIEKEFDTVYITSIAEIYFIVDFEDSVDADDIVSTLSVSEAKDQLEDTLDSAKKKIKKESSYSVETFEPFKKAYNEALTAFNGTSSAAKLEILNRKLKQTMSELKDSDKDDKNLRNAYDELQSVIKEAEKKKAADYTTDSFKTLTTELKNAKAVSITNTTLSKIETRTSALNKAINMLVTIAADNELKAAISKLKNLISTAETKLKSQSEYTSDSVSKLNTALTNAKKLNTGSASLSEIKTQSSNLEAAIDGLVSKTIGNYEALRKTLKSNYDGIMSISNSDGTYTADSYSKFTEQRDTIHSEYTALPSIDEVSSMSSSQISSETTKVNNLITKISNAKKLLVSSKLEAARENLRTALDKAKAIKEADWHVDDVSYSALQSKITSYEKLLANTSATVDQLDSATTDLAVLLMKN